jgi:hypothetical protein
MRIFIKPLILLFCSVSLLTTACAPEEQKTASSPSDAASSPLSNQTQPQTQTPLIQQVDGFQVSFEVNTMAEHHQLMQSMKMEMADHGADMPSHYVMVTLLDEQKKPVADAPLKIKIIAPDGKALMNEAGVTAETMRGEGMFHYGHGFDLSAPGRYQMLLMFTQGGTSHQTGVYWNSPE